MNDFERWRGEVTATLEYIKQRLEVLAAFDARLKEVEKAQSVVSGKLVLLGAGAVVLLGEATRAVLDHLLR